MSFDPRSPLGRRVAPTAPARTSRSAPETDAAAAREAADVLSRIQTFAGGEAEALAWFHTQPIPALGGRTAETLIKMGEVVAVRRYLDTLATGGFA